MSGSAEVRRRMKWSEIEEDTDIDVVLGNTKTVTLENLKAQCQQDEEQKESDDEIYQEFHDCNEWLTKESISLATKVDDEYLDVESGSSSTAVDSASGSFEADSPLSSSLDDPDDPLSLSVPSSPEAESIHPEAATAETPDALTSVGAEFHFENQCIPCKFLVSRSGCKDGANCIYCHAPHPELNQGQRRRLMSRINRKKRQDAMFEGPPQESWVYNNDPDGGYKNNEAEKDGDGNGHQPFGHFLPQLLCANSYTQVNNQSSHKPHPDQVSVQSSHKDRLDQVAGKSWYGSKNHRLQNKPLYGSKNQYAKSSYNGYSN